MKELFGQRLQEQRQNQGLTMEQLAEKANLSSNFIGAIERGLLWTRHGSPQGLKMPSLRI